MTTIRIWIYTISNEIDMETLNLSHYPSVETTTTTTLISSPQLQLENALSAIFPQPTEENQIISARRKLGETAKTLTDEQIECMVTDFQYLIDTWLDEFECEVFGGKTLKNLLGEKEYANTK